MGAPVRTPFGGLHLGYGGDGHFHARDSDGELCALAGRRVRWKPLDPLFIHSGKVRFFENDDRGAYDAIERSACGVEDGRYVFQTLSSLLLDRIANDLAGYRIVRPRARDEDETRRAYRLTVGWRRSWGVGRSDNFSWHIFSAGGDVSDSLSEAQLNSEMRVTTSFGRFEKTSSHSCTV
jgi:hypothetical protein